MGDDRADLIFKDEKTISMGLIHGQSLSEIADNIIRFLAMFELHAKKRHSLFGIEVIVEIKKQLQSWDSKTT
mgnify:CR=1 FL=1